MNTGALCPILTAKADYSVPVDLGFETGVNMGFHYIQPVTVPDGALYLRVNSIIADNMLDRYQLSTTNVGYTSATNISAYPVDIDMTNYQGSTLYARFFHHQGTGVGNSIISSYDAEWVFPGDAPDNTNVMSEDKQITQYVYDFTQDISFPAHDFFHFYLDGDLADIADKVYAIEVRGSTVGGNQLSWRLSYAYNGYINTTGAWIDPGSGWFSGKLPLDRSHPYDYWSIGLRLLNDDGTEYTPLLPSEIEYVAVTLHYKETVYLQIPPGEYQTLPTTEMPTLQTFTVPALSDTSGYLAMPMDLTTRIFNWVNTIDGFPVLLGVMMFVTIIFICIW